jgi:hypothetical protein
VRRTGRPGARWLSGDPQLVDLLLPGSQGAHDRLDQAIHVSPAYRTARSGLGVVFYFI